MPNGILRRGKTSRGSNFNGWSTGSKSAYTEPVMVPMTRATCTEEPYDSKRITYGSGTAGGGATRLLTVTN